MPNDIMNLMQAKSSEFKEKEESNKKNRGLLRLPNWGFHISTILHHQLYLKWIEFQDLFKDQRYI